jgi:PAS domain-containing protein
MREIEQSVDSLRRVTSEMSRGLTLQAEAERMGGFGTTVRDLETGEYWLSEGAYHIIGRRRLSALSRVSAEEQYVDALHPDDLEAVLAEVAAGIEDGAEHDIVHRIVRPDGEVRLIHSTGRRIDATDGHNAILLVATVDITPPA